MDRIILITLAILLSFVPPSANAGDRQRPAPISPTATAPGAVTTERTRTMQIAWADEGNGPNGVQADPNLWQYRPTDQWQNPTELQNYTAGANNAYYDGNGHLILKTVKEASGGKNYSSARLRSPKLWTYGVFEARLQIPNGGGIWPAFWLLGQDGEFGWPYCGEVDVMEAPASASEVGYIHQGTHTPNTANGNDVAVGIAAGRIPLANPADWHTYSIDWQRDSIEFFIDHKSSGKVTRANVEASGGSWTFDHRPLSPILNLAVGGWAGTPDPAWTTQTMVVDYVRIYQ